MKHLKSYILFVWMALVATGCAYDDLKDEMKGLDGRVTLIEEQVKILNDNVEVMGYILAPQNKTINSVRTTGSGENRQHIITLSDGTELVLTAGKPGTIDEPEITVGEDNYWYINGESTGVSAVGTDGKNGDGYPEFRVEAGKWQIRFGTDGEWGDVPGGNLASSTGSLGDHIFESATVEGDNFVIILKNGRTYTLPIVSGLVCVIDRDALTMTAGYLLLEKDGRTTIDIKIEGENPQVVYPQGWRAVLAAKDVADVKGNTHTIYIYTPAIDVSTTTRAAANNTEDIAVSVQKGIFWAMDKIRVKVGTETEPEPEPTGNMKTYNDGGELTVGEFKFSKTTFGGTPVTEITGGTADISGSGVYFVSANNAVLTYTGENVIDNLVIIPNSGEIGSITLNVNKQVKFTGTFVCQNVEVANGVEDNYALAAEGENLNVIFDNCKINGLKGGFGLIKKGDAPSVSVADFYVGKSDIKIEAANSSLYLISDINKVSNLTVDNSIIYYSGDEVAQMFRVLNAEQNVPFEIEKLKLSQNTFVDVISCNSGSFGALIYRVEPADKISGFIATSSLISSNLFSTKSLPNVMYFITSLGAQYNDGLFAIGTNHWFVGTLGEKATFSILYRGNSALTNNKPVMCGTDIFNRGDNATFDKSTGVFKPIEAYKAYGAQRD